MSLPSLNDLYANIEVAAKQNDLNRLLNAKPKDEWVKDHPFAKGVKYIPIGMVEYLLTAIFQRWRVEVVNTQVIANSVVVTVRLHFQDPLTMEWDWQDGIGAAPIQTAKGAAATDFTQVVTDAVTKAAPAAESYAVKDAAEKIGRIFGKDLNRKEYLPYTNLEGKIDLEAVEAGPERTAELYALLNDASLHPEEHDEYAYRIEKGISVAEYQLIKRELQDRVLHPIDRVRNGENVSAKVLSKAIKDVAQ